MSRLSLTLWLVLLLPLAASAQEMGTVTLLEGPLRIMRGTEVLRGSEGVKLRRGDIVESSNTGFVQVELPGGAVFALGPSTGAFFRGRAGDAAEVVVLSGWLKAEIAPTAGAYRCASPLLAATTRGGSVVLHADGDGSSIFVESGAAGISSVTPGGNVNKPGAANAGQFYTRRAGQPPAMASRPTAAFVDALPHPFRDTLPSRLARFSGKAIAPHPDHEVSYAEVQPWLTMGQSWRRGFVARFEPRLKDPEFRRAVDAHLSAHPEWDPILHPEKYESKTRPSTDVSQPQR
jgi:hypothetical protein